MASSISSSTSLRSAPSLVGLSEKALSSTSAQKAAYAKYAKPTYTISSFKDKHFFTTGDFIDVNKVFLSKLPKLIKDSILRYHGYLYNEFCSSESNGSTKVTGVTVVTYRDSYKGENKFSAACKAGDLEWMKDFYESEEMSQRNKLLKPSKQNEYPLFFAASSGKINAIKYIFNLDPSALEQITIYGSNVLQMVARSGNLESIKFILSELSKLGEGKLFEFVNKIDNEGNTIFHYVAKSGNLDAFSFLHRYVEDLTQRRAKKSASNESPSIPLISRVNKAGDTVMHTAARSESASMLEVIHKIDPDQIKKIGRLKRTVMGNAIESHDIPTIQKVFELDPEQIIKPSAGKKPLEDVKSDHWLASLITEIERLTNIYLQKK